MLYLSSVVLTILINFYIPSYLAVKAVKTLYPSLPMAEKREELLLWIFTVLAMYISLVLLLESFGIDTSLVIPIRTWAPLIPTVLHELFGNIQFNLSIFVFIAKFTI